MKHEKFSHKSKHNFTKALTIISEQLMLIENTIVTVSDNEINKN